MALTAAELQEIGLIVIVRSELPTDLVHLARALAAGGVRAMEITLPTPGALDGIARIRQELGPKMRVGAGTVLGAVDAQAARDAGAEYLITPTLQMDTVALCVAQEIPLACGCMTPTEALAAQRAGADFIKLFPADTLGPAYVRALLAPLPFLKIIPTGGVSLENIADYVKAGSVGVAVGSNLVSKRALRENDWPGLTNLAHQYVEALAAARQ